MCGMWWDSGQYCTRQATASNNLCLIGGTRECQDVLCERGTHLSILVMMIKNGRSVLMCQCFYTEMIFFPPFGFPQVMLERENGGSCRPFYSEDDFPAVTTATFVQNESRWPLFLPKHGAGMFRKENVHQWLSDWQLFWMQLSTLVWQLIDWYLLVIVMQHP